MWNRTLLASASLLLIALPASTAGKSYSHQEYFEHYEGTQTCLECHQDEAEAFFSSQHYQWRGGTPDLVNSHGQKLGKMNMVNDFCTNPLSSWIGEVRSDEGKLLAAGCSKCHAGHGKLPSAEMTEEQLLNIDCLMCHASGYNRTLVGDQTEGWEWRPLLWKNREGLDSVAKRISRPTRTMCLRCHAASGGGPNFKRGDIEYVLREPDYDFDVHMSPDGADLHCVDCHAGSDHRVRGRGVDLAATDLVTEPLRCDDGRCHENDPHAKQLLNRHAQRVDCTVCHIPEFAKEEPTDMFRDWSDGHFSEAKGKHVARIDLESNVVPIYAWFNGKSKVQLPQEKAEFDDEGRIVMVQPLGSREDSEARIHAFKLHRGKLPVLDEQGWILPVKVDDFYAHGDIELAVRDATHDVYGVADAQFRWVSTIRYMGIFHEVQPADGALRCLDCHGADTRLDWMALGYEADPLDGCLPKTD
ncbi:MAG: hypothetical protein GY906_39875 [bacterium]|nr:hypothetical protein [bacterium]